MSIRSAALVLGTCAAYGAAVGAAELDMSRCTMPAAPSVPDGSLASKEEMLTAQSAVQGYVDAGNATLECLQGLEASLGEEITVEQQKILVDSHNGTIADMEAVAARYKAAVEAYKAQ